MVDSGLDQRHCLTIVDENHSKSLSFTRIDFNGKDNCEWTHFMARNKYLNFGAKNEQMWMIFIHCVQLSMRNSRFLPADWARFRAKKMARF